MLTEYQRKMIVRNIPEKFKIDGIEFHIHKRYSNQFAFDVFPTITLTYTDMSAFRGHWPIINNLMRSTNRSIDEVVFDSNSWVYDLAVDQPNGLQSVTGIVSGNAYTFEIGTIDDPKEVFLNGSRQLEFTTTLPDDRTVFVVDYTHRSVRVVLGNEVNDSLQVDVWAEDYKNENTKEFVNGIKIVDFIASEILKWFRYTLDIYDSSGRTVNVVMKPTTAIRNLDGLMEASVRRRRQFEIDVAHIESITRIDPSIEVVEWSFQDVFP